MKKSFVGILALGVATTITCAPLAASAAPPLTLPAGDTIYQTDFYAEVPNLWSTASDGSSTVLGTPAASDLDNVSDGAWDPTTGKSYLIGGTYVPDSVVLEPCELWAASVSTGQFSKIAPITLDSAATTNCDAFDIAPDGTAWVTMNRTNTTATLAQLNLTDGTTSHAVSLTGLVNGISWIVIEPSTGVMYAGDWSKNVFTLETTSGLLTKTVDGSTIPIGGPFDGGAYDAAFDSNGKLWLTNLHDLFSATVTDAVATIAFQGRELVNGSDAGESGSLWIARPRVDTPSLSAPTHELATTGTAPTAPLALGFVLFTAGLVAAAGAVVLRRGRNMRRI